MNKLRNQFLGGIAALLIGGGVGFNFQPPQPGSEPDREYQAVAGKLPIVGYDLDRSGLGHLSQIEDSIVRDGKTVYTNVRIRFRFLTPVEKSALVQRFATDTGLTVQERKQPQFDTAGVNGPLKDPLDRAAYYIDVPDANIKQMPLEKLLYLTLGKDANGRQIYFTSQGYKIEVNGPGKFTCDPIPDPPEGEPLCEPGFRPARVP